MIGIVRQAAGAALAAVSALALGALSQIPYVPEPRPDAMLRLSWRSRGERIEQCREVSAEEQQKLPAHMRERRVCEGRNAVYRLKVAVDGVQIIDQVAQGSGTRQRRPIFVFREARLAPGLHEIRVEFTRQGEGSGQEGGRDDREEREKNSALPPRLELETTAALEPRQVILVTYDADRRRLVELRREPSPTDE